MHSAETSIATDGLPHPVLMNAWKHHAGWIMGRIAEARRTGTIHQLPDQLLIVGQNLMDLYVGDRSPAELGTEVLDQLRTDDRLSPEPYLAWLAEAGGYRTLTLSDGAVWTLRAGPADDRYVHLHPGRWSPHTLRVQANALRTAVLVLADCPESPWDLASVNRVRRQYLGLAAMREVTAAGGVGEVIRALERLRV